MSYQEKKGTHLTTSHIMPIIVAKEAGALSDHIADDLLVSATKRNPCALLVCAWQSLVLVIVTLDFSQSEMRRLE
jgi:hypothetical protein